MSENRIIIPVSPATFRELRAVCGLVVLGMDPEKMTSDTLILGEYEIRSTGVEAPQPQPFPWLPPMPAPTLPVPPPNWPQPSDSPWGPVNPYGPKPWWQRGYLACYAPEGDGGAFHGPGKCECCS